jgi:hypothetical protein
VNFIGAMDKVQRRIKRAVRENRRKPRGPYRPRKPRESAAVSLADHRPQPEASRLE